MTEQVATIRKIKNKVDFKSLLWILPVLIVLIFLNFYPILDSIYFSMTNFNQSHFFKYGFVGFQNYSYIFASPALVSVIVNTLVWSVGSTVIMVPAGFILALIMNQKNLRGKYLYRTLYLFPWAFPAFITILIWKNMFAYNGGVINSLLGMIGFSAIPWLTLPNYAMFSIIFVNLWLSFPYYTFVYTSAVQSIPHELYEAAEMDGYGSFRTLTNVTLPLLKRQISFITIFGFIFTWNNFYVPFLLTGGGPGISTQILITYSYQEAFALSSYELGAAYAIISILILFVFVIITNHYTKMMSILY